MMEPSTTLYYNLNLLFAGSNAQPPEVIMSVRTWRAGLCFFCGKFETGHSCKGCKKLCCNLCNTIQVEDLSDISCPECSYQVADEIIPESVEENDASEVVKKTRGRPAKPVTAGQILIPLEKKKRGRPKVKKIEVTEQAKRARGRPSKASYASVKDFIEDSSSDDEEIISELRILGKENIFSKIFVDEALTCDSPVECHMFDILMDLRKPLPCYYCGEKDPRKIKENLTDEKFPLCQQCQAKGRGAGTRRRSRKVIPKAGKGKKPVNLKIKRKKETPDVRCEYF